MAATHRNRYNVDFMQPVGKRPLGGAPLHSGVILSLETSLE